MIKTQKGELTPQIVSTLTYLQSLLDDKESVTIHLTRDNVSVAIGYEGLISPIEMGKLTYNPIKDLLDHINDEMCTDCVSQDWLYKHSYFSSLARSYVDTLLHEFGNGAPIPTPLARAILVHKISDHIVIAKGFGHDRLELIPGENWGFKENDGWMYYIEARK